MRYTVLQHKKSSVIIDDNPDILTLIIVVQDMNDAVTRVRNACYVLQSSKMPVLYKSVPGTNNVKIKVRFHQRHLNKLPKIKRALVRISEVVNVSCRDSGASQSKSSRCQPKL